MGDIETEKKYIEGYGDIAGDQRHKNVHKNDWFSIRCLCFCRMVRCCMCLSLSCALCVMFRRRMLHFLYVFVSDVCIIVTFLLTVFVISCMF